MKKFAKFTVLAIAVVLLSCLTVGFSASAETTAPNVEAKNVKVDGNFCLMFAVLPETVSGDEVTLKIYDKTPADGVEPIQTITKAKTETASYDINNDGAKEDVIVFESAGVSAKDIADTWWYTVESDGAVSAVETYSVREYAFERLYGDNKIAATDTYGTRQKSFYLSILSVGSTAQDLLVNTKLEENNETPERLANEYSYASIFDGSFGDATQKFVEIGDTLTLTAADGFTAPSWKVYTYGKNGSLLKLETVELGSTVNVAGNTVILPGWAEGLTPGKYFSDIGDAELSYDNVTSFADTVISTTTSADGANYGHNAIIAETGRGNVANIGKLDTETSKGRTWISVVDKANGAGTCLVIEMDIKMNADAIFTADEITNGVASTAGSVITILSDESSTGGWNGTSTICNWNNYVRDNTENVTASNLNGGNYWNINGKLDLEENKWYNLCIEIYDSGNIVVYIDGDYATEWTFSENTKNTTEFNKPSLAKSVRIDLQERFRPSEMYFDNMFIGVVAKTYTEQ